MSPRIHGASPSSARRPPQPSTPPASRPTTPKSSSPRNTSPNLSPPSWPPLAQGASILHPRAAAARDELPEALTAAGALVTLADTYRTIIPPTSIAALTDLLAINPPDAITFTSASTAQNLAALLAAANLSIPFETVLASIGPLTSRAMRSVGLEPTLEAPESTILALAHALASHFQTR